MDDLGADVAFRLLSHTFHVFLPRDELHEHSIPADKAFEEVDRYSKPTMPARDNGREHDWKRRKISSPPFSITD